jgi:DNA-directed RNA polymerase subunit beta'
MSSGPLSIPSLEKSKSFMVSAKDMKPEKGGLFDPALTGGLSGTRWAHMELAEPVVNPVFEEPVRRFLGMTKAQLRAEIGEVGGTGIRDRLNRLDLAKKKKELLELTKHKKGADLDNAIKQLKYLRALKKGDHKRAGTAYTLSRLAVVPPVMRPILPSQRGNELQVSDLNYLYRDVGLASEALRGISDLGLPGATADARHHLHDAAGALFGTMKPTSPQLKGREAKGFIEQITGTGSPKTGFMHKMILARRQDLSGRATATPDNTLDMDQIGIPEDMLWKTYSKFIMRGLVNQGYKPAMAADMIEERHPTGKLILDGEMQKRPIIVNRAPSLHKHNLVAAYPVSVPGKSLRVNPFMERGQNLDYDGDAMQLHVPISEKAVAEAQELTLSKLLFSDKNRDDLMVFPQHEAILGTYLATATKEPGKAKRFKNKAAAMAAYRKGHITMNTPVTIG